MLQKLSPNSPILQATFGIERESLRINANHKVAQTPHPEKLGSRSFHPYIQTDYSEPQIELITPIAHSTKEARRFLGAITDVVMRIPLALIHATCHFRGRHPNCSTRK